jgi:CBS domain-containing protein
MPVVNEQGDLVGMISATDALWYLPKPWKEPGKRLS